LARKRNVFFFVKRTESGFDYLVKKAKKAPKRAEIKMSQNQTLIFDFHTEVRKIIKTSREELFLLGVTFHNGFYGSFF